MLPSSAAAGLLLLLSQAPSATAGKLNISNIDFRRNTTGQVMDAHGATPRLVPAPTS